MKGHLVRTLLRFRGARESLAAGYTLVEMMVGIALASLLLLGVASMYLFSLKSFTSMSNYIQLNAASEGEE